MSKAISINYVFKTSTGKSAQSFERLDQAHNWIAQKPPAFAKLLTLYKVIIETTSELINHVEPSTNNNTTDSTSNGVGETVQQ